MKKFLVIFLVFILFYGNTDNVLARTVREQNIFNITNDSSLINKQIGNTQLVYPKQYVTTQLLIWNIKHVLKYREFIGHLEVMLPTVTPIIKNEIVRETIDALSNNGVQLGKRGSMEILYNISKQLPLSFIALASAKGQKLQKREDIHEMDNGLYPFEFKLVQNISFFHFNNDIDVVYSYPTNMKGDIPLIENNIRKLIASFVQATEFKPVK